MTNFLAGQLGFVLELVPWLGMNDAHLLAHVCIALSMAMSVRLDSGVRLDSAGSALPLGCYVSSLYSIILAHRQQGIWKGTEIEQTLMSGESPETSGFHEIE